MTPQEHLDAAKVAVVNAQAWGVSDRAQLELLTAIAHAVIAGVEAIDMQLHNLSEAVDR